VIVATPPSVRSSGKSAVSPMAYPLLRGENAVQQASMPQGSSGTPQQQIH